MQVRPGVWLGRRGRHRSVAGLGPRFTALWVGQAASMLGDYVAYVTLPLFVLQLARSNMDFAITYALENIPTMIIGLAGGVLLDRLNLRSVMIVSDLARAGAFVLLAQLAGTEDPGLSGVFALAFLIGSFSAGFQNALWSIIPSLVRHHQMVSANARITATQQAAFVVGPAVGGVLWAAVDSPSLGFLINGATFLVSAASLMFVGQVEDKEIGASRGFVEEALHGLRFLWGELRLRWSTTAAAVANFVVGFIEATFVVFTTQVLGTTTEQQFGLTVTALGLGGVAGAAVASRISRVFGLGRTMTIGMGLFGLAMWVAVNSSYGLSALLVMFSMFVGLSLINVPLATIRQLYTPAAILGRVIAASRAIGWSTLPLGALLGAAISDAAGYRRVALFAPAVIIITAIGLVFTPIWRDTFGPHRGKRVAGPETSAPRRG
jgi:MFS family permease